MDDDRTFWFSLLIYKAQIKTLRKIEIKLDGRQLPLTTDRILEHEV